MIRLGFVLLGTLLMALTVVDANAQTEKDTVFLQSGQHYIGRIVEFKPEIEVSIITENGDALVVPMDKVLRISRNTSIYTGSGRRAGERAPGHWTDGLHNEPYASISVLSELSQDAGTFLTNSTSAGRSSSGVIGSLSYGVTAILNAGLITRNGTSVLINAGYGIGDYLSGMDDNLIYHASNRRLIGLGFALDGQGIYVTSSINYVQNTYEYQYRFASTTGVQRERFTGVGISSVAMFPLTKYVGLSMGPSLEYMTLDHDGASFLRIQFELGVSWSTILGKLSKYY